MTKKKVEVAAIAVVLLLVFMAVKIIPFSKKSGADQNLAEEGTPYKLEVLGGKDEVVIENVCRHKVVSSNVLSACHCGRVAVCSQIYLDGKGYGFRVVENVPTNKRCETAVREALNKIYRAKAILYKLRHEIEDVNYYGWGRNMSEAIWDIGDSTYILEHQTGGGE